MLYDEFIAGTGCRDTAKNYRIFRDLEVMYMASDTITKAEIYEYGKKLVDNSLTDAQKAWNEDIDKRIEQAKGVLDTCKADLARYEANRDFCKNNNYWDDVSFWGREIKWKKNQIKGIKYDIKQLKECKYV